MFVCVCVCACVFDNNRYSDLDMARFADACFDMDNAVRFDFWELTMLRRIKRGLQLDEGKAPESDSDADEFLEGASAFVPPLVVGAGRARFAAVSRGSGGCCEQRQLLLSDPPPRILLS